MTEFQFQSNPLTKESSPCWPNWNRTELRRSIFFRKSNDLRVYKTRKTFLNDGVQDKINRKGNVCRKWLHLVVDSSVFYPFLDLFRTKLRLGCSFEQKCRRLCHRPRNVQKFFTNNLKTLCSPFTVSLYPRFLPPSTKVDESSISTNKILFHKPLTTDKIKSLFLLVWFLENPCKIPL